ncbi:MAG: immune inhibitor A [Ignavibacteria bacterium]|nr:immune inhibitor A [Ignavibacteria bacterium]
MKYKSFFSALIIVALATVFMSSDMINYRAANSPLETYSKVKIIITSAEQIKTLLQNDISLEHYQGNFKEGIEVVINQSEISRLKSAGINYEIMIADMNDYYANRPQPTQEEMTRSRNIQQNDNAAGFSYGSMGGFHTYTELVQKLDSLRLQYPTLITAKQDRGTTEGGRKIWSVKISDNADVNESATEPAIYFDALHHAREPISMEALLYYMYWLLDNYNTNPEAKYLVDNREIYFIPVVNPDGYAYNQQTNPNGGGSWRKNRRNNGSCFGVDLNRNYSFGWGYDNSGSSPDPCSDTYRGPSANSEPESQAVKNLIDAILPKISFSAHSVAGRYLNPFGFKDSSVAYEIYSDFSSDFSSENDYLYGTVWQMLDYYSNGTTRDYLQSKGTYCWTPEIGGSGFWPAVSEIVPLCNENLGPLKYLTWVGGDYARMQNFKVLGKGYVEKNDTLSLEVSINNKGLSKTAKNVVVSVSSPYPNLTALNASVNYDSIQARTIKKNSSNLFKFIVGNSAVLLDEIKLIITVKQENITTTIDTVKVNVGKQSVLFFDNAENGIGNWTTAGTGTLWDTSYISPYEGNKSFADSRYGNSKNSSNNTFTLTNPISLTGVLNPRIEFATRFATEKGFDYARIQVSSNNGSTWTSLPGKYTTTVSSQPSYSGNQSWVVDQINLASYSGQSIRIRFNYVSDAGQPGDGFFFDNFKVLNYTVTTGVAQVSSEVPDKFSLSQNYPNPFNPATRINYSIAKQGFVALKIYDVTGKVVANLVSENQNPGSYSVDFAANDFPSGTYFYKLETNDFSEVKRMVLVK